MVDPEVTPPKDKGTEPVVDKEIKPEVTESEVTEGDTVTLSKEEFTDWQTKIVDLETKVEKSEKEKVKMERDQKFTELKRLNPKLAELNKNAKKSTLETVIITAKTMKGQFPSISDGDAKPVKKAEVGYRTLDSKEWVTNNLE